MEHSPVTDYALFRYQVVEYLWRQEEAAEHRSREALAHEDLPAEN
jgi:hypothetical protein